MLLRLFETRLLKHSPTILIRVFVCMSDDDAEERNGIGSKGCNHFQRKSDGLKVIRIFLSLLFPFRSTNHHREYNTNTRTHFYMYSEKRDRQSSGAFGLRKNAFIYFSPHMIVIPLSFPSSFSSSYSFVEHSERREKRKKILAKTYITSLSRLNFHLRRSIYRLLLLPRV